MFSPHAYASLGVDDDLVDLIDKLLVYQVKIYISDLKEVEQFPLSMLCNACQ